MDVFQAHIKEIQMMNNNLTSRNLRLREKGMEDLRVLILLIIKEVIIKDF